MRAACCVLRGRALAWLGAAGLLSSCATTPPQSAPAAADTASVVQGVTRTAAPWGIEVREHVDLWLHGFAMLQRDTARVPFFERGYAQRYLARKTAANIITIFDANRDRLEPRLIGNPQLVNAQFLPLYFATWEDMTRSIDLTLEVEGDARRVADPVMQRAVSVVAAYFPRADDREWLRVFTMSLREERDRFWREWWLERQAEREPALARLDTLWQDEYRPKLQRFLNNTRQQNGDFLVSLPLDGEGRALTGGTTIRVNVVAVSFPPTRERAVEAIYVLAHEIVGSITSTVIADHTTPAERRDGLDQRFSSHALVRGGAMLLQRATPELADGYARYYLEAAGVPVPSQNLQAALAQAFPLPEAMSQALARQIDIVLGGI